MLLMPPRNISTFISALSSRPTEYAKSRSNYKRTLEKSGWHPCFRRHRISGPHAAGSVLRRSAKLTLHSLGEMTFGCHFQVFNTKCLADMKADKLGCRYAPRWLHATFCRLHHRRLTKFSCLFPLVLILASYTLCGHVIL